jgi:hypothetical protein
MTAAVIATSQVVVAVLRAEVDAGRHEYQPSPAYPDHCCARVTVAGVMPCHRAEGDRVHMTSRRLIAALKNGGPA